MIKAKIGGVWFFGLTRDNINRLTSNDPILIKSGDIDGLENSVCIFFGEELQELIKNLEKLTGARFPGVIENDPGSGIN